MHTIYSGVHFEIYVSKERAGKKKEQGRGKLKKKEGETERNARRYASVVAPVPAATVPSASSSSATTNVRKGEGWRLADVWCVDQAALGPGVVRGVCRPVGPLGPVLLPLACANPDRNADLAKLV